MDETAIFLEMSFNTTIDFKGNKHINIDTNGREHYRITALLSGAGDGTKLTPLIIVKGEKGKTVEQNLRNLPYAKNKNMLIYCNPNAWCDKFIFSEWLFKIFLKYQTALGEKCLLIVDSASSHSSEESINILNTNNINYLLIPAGMTALLHPMDISTNKVFKDNIRYLFEKDRLLYDNINPKVKLQTARINILNYINTVWNNEEPINKNIIKNGFKNAKIIGNSYISLEEEKIRNNALYDLNLNFNKIELIDDLGKELNMNFDALDNDGSDKDDKDLIENIELDNNYKNEIQNIEEDLKKDYLNKMDIDDI